MDNTHILTPFADGEHTSLVDMQLLQHVPVTMLDDFEANLLELTQNIVAINERKAFLEGVASYLGNFDVEDTEGMFKEVQRRYADKGIDLTKTIKGWFLKPGVSPSIDQSYRRNLYDFCVAMGMDYAQTAEFFLKSFLTIPYNYKDRIDAIYFYCLKARRPYSVIKKMIEVSEGFESTNQDVNGTEAIGKFILNLNSDEEFLHYLRHHCYDRQHQYTTAKTTITDLVTRNKEIMPDETIEEIATTEKKPRNRAIKDPKRNPAAKQNKKLFAKILGYSYQNLNSEERERLSSSGLPAFPQDGDLSKIMSEDKAVSSDVLRKSLILMKFYNYYQTACIEDNYVEPDDPDVIQDRLCDFMCEVDDTLAECGFVQLYVRNPYDAIIIFCANSPNPIGCLKDFIDKRYFGNAD